MRTSTTVISPDSTHRSGSGSKSGDSRIDTTSDARTRKVRNRRRPNRARSTALPVRDRNRNERSSRNGNGSEAVAVRLDTERVSAACHGDDRVVAPVEHEVQFETFPGPNHR